MRTTYLLPAKRRATWLLAASVLSCAALAGTQTAPDTATPKSVEQAMKDGMQAMQSIPVSGDVDKDFAALMKAHHEQAVKMAEVELRDGRSPELKAMARKMIHDQQHEIDMLGKWLQQKH
ncbi:MAG: DUF305 domain-containing protein [Acidobacteriota bacterium]